MVWKRLRSDREFADQAAAQAQHVSRKIRVFFGIHGIQSASEYTDADTPGLYRTLMCGRIYATGKAAHHGHAGLCQITRDAPRHLSAVAGIPAGAHDGNGRLWRIPSLHIQKLRRIWDFPQPDRETFVLRGNSTDAQFFHAADCPFER